jgi:5-methyltetrahydropteroyltriglutamate--homocysteine methyltransferase
MLTVNLALKGIPEEKVRFRTCYGINEGPRLCELALSEVMPYALTTLRRKFSFEAANPRHEHEYRLFETVKLPAKLVGRENAMGGTDCGFASQASYRTEVHPCGKHQGDGTRRRHRDEAALGQKCCGNKLATGLISA